MKARKIEDLNSENALVSLLKVFDVNFINEPEQRELDGLNVNSAEDVRIATRKLVLPSLNNYTLGAQQTIVKALQASVTKTEDQLRHLFNGRIGLAFDQDLTSRRAFLEAVKFEVQQHLRASASD